MSDHILRIPWPINKAKKTLVPVFLPFRGCKVRCIFCAQDLVTGQPEHGSKLSAILFQLRLQLEKRLHNGQKAPELGFFGGTFTALPQTDLLTCLDFVDQAYQDGLITSFRCSTRPDYINSNILDLLKSKHCTTVELGIQSFSDKALTFSQRGYSGQEAEIACQAVKTAGLQLGVQLLPGMPYTDPQIFQADVRKALHLQADMLRFYPCLVLKGTGLADLWQRGLYQTWSMQETLTALAWGWLQAQEAGVPVIRMGLAPEKGLQEAILDGPVHWSLGSRVMAWALLFAVRKLVNYQNTIAKLEVPSACRGFFWGHCGELRSQWQKLGVQTNNLCFTSQNEITIRL